MSVWNVILFLIVIIIAIILIFFLFYMKGNAEEMNISTKNPKEEELKVMDERSIEQIQIFPSLEIKGWKNINPSIMIIDNQYIMAYRLHKRSLSQWRSKIGISILNDKLEVMESFFFNDNTSLSSMAIGYEDPRIFSYNDQIYSVASLKEDKTDWMYLLNLDLNKKIIVDSKRQETPFGEDSKKPQKNWNPFIYENKLHFTTRVNPHKIISGNDLYETRNEYLDLEEKKGKRIHGGTKPVYFNNSYIAVGHYKYTGFYYTSFFYEFEQEPPFRIKRISNEFILPIPKEYKVMGTKIQMVTGLERCIDNDRDFLLGVGLMDAAMCLYKINSDYIETLLNENKTQETLLNENKR